MLDGASLCEFAFVSALALHKAYETSGVRARRLTMRPWMRRQEGREGKSQGRENSTSSNNQSGDCDAPQSKTAPKSKSKSSKTSSNQRNGAPASYRDNVVQGDGRASPKSSSPEWLKNRDRLRMSGMKWVVLLLSRIRCDVEVWRWCLLNARIYVVNNIRRCIRLSGM